MKLRSYQRAAVNAVLQYFYEGNKGHPLVVAPTGSGKSWIIGGLCAQIHKKWPDENVLIVTHTKEIIQQDYSILRKFISPDLIGINSAGLGYRQSRQFTIGSIQSIYKYPSKFAAYKLIIVDEAHLIPPSGEGRYRQLFEALPDAKVVGVTATPFRRGHGMLIDNHMFDRIVYDIKMQTLIDLGHLVPLTTKHTEHTLDVSGLKVIGGDYSKKELSRRFDQNILTNKIVDSLLPFWHTHKKWLVFAIDIEHCKHIAARLNLLGVKAAAVHSKLDIDRQHLIDLFKEGYLKALVSVETLTTGFDVPEIDLIAMMRPTASPVLHVQMLGRGMRPAPNKDKCLVLDYAGNVSRLGPVDAVEVKPKGKKGKGDGNGFTRVCPECDEIVHIKVKTCPACGYEFPPNPKLETKADEAPIMSAELRKNPIVTEIVQEVTYSKHRKSGKPPSFKVTYRCGPVKFYTEYIAPEHKGYPQHRARAWWNYHAGNDNVPKTVDEMLARKTELKKPTRIRVDRLDKYPKIIGFHYD